MKPRVLLVTLLLQLASSTCAAAGGELEFTATLPADLESDGWTWKMGSYRFVIDDWSVCRMRAIQVNAGEAKVNDASREIHGVCGFARLGSASPRVSTLTTRNGERVAIVFETPDYKVQRARVVLLRFEKRGAQ
jgi:hypothetical protein